MNKYKKIIKWKKKPSMVDFMAGFIGIALSILMIVLCFFEDDSIALLTLIFTSVLIFSFNMMLKNNGKKKEVYYIKLGGRRNEN